MPKNVLMTGATGYLGSHIARRLVASGKYRLMAIKRRSSSLQRLEGVADQMLFFDIEDLDWDRLFGEQAVDVMLHCATNYGRREESRSNIVTTNLLLPLRLLEACASHGVSAFINTDTMLDKGVSYYGLSKSQFRDWLKAFSGELLGMNLVLEHFFGPGDDPSKFVTYVLHELLNGAESIPLTKGEQKRDFIHIDDVVAAFETVLDHACRQGAAKGFYEYPIGTGEAVSIADFVTMARQLSGSRTRLDFGALPYRVNEPMHVKVDTSRIRELGWNPRYGLRQALESTIALERGRLSA